MSQCAVPFDVPTVRAALLAFYEAHRRVLPWRETTDPYAIWVSEIMLQQTQVDTVVPRYERFMRQFPSVSSLAAARCETVCEAWAGLGYYRRARHLHAAACAVVRHHAGRVPSDPTALLALPGVGRYTAAAIASIAFGLPTPVVDGNVERVLARLGALEDAPDTPLGKKTLWAWASALVQGARPGELNQAVMELGATVCRPLAPKCARCPVQKACAAKAGAKQSRYPRPSRKAPRQPLKIAFALVREPLGVLLVQRNLDGLWAGLWEPPSAHGRGAKKALAARYHLKLGPPLATVRHSLTHRDVTATVYAGKRCGSAPAEATMRLSLTPFDEPLSTLAVKALQAALSDPPVGSRRMAAS